MAIFDESPGHFGELSAAEENGLDWIDGVVLVVTAEESGGAFTRVRVEHAGGALASDVTDPQPATSLRSSQTQPQWASQQGWYVRRS